MPKRKSRQFGASKQKPEPIIVVESHKKFIKNQKEIDHQIIQNDNRYQQSSSKANSSLLQF